MFYLKQRLFSFVVFFLYFYQCLCVLCLQANGSLNVFNEMTKSVAAIVKLCLCCLLVGLFHLSRWIDVQVKSVMTSDFLTVGLTLITHCNKQ